MTAEPLPGILCLQGGREFTPPCEAMDRTVIGRCDGAVAVLAGAARVGSDYTGASARAADHYRALGAEVTIVPDPRDDPTRALAVLGDGIGLIVMPGGSPSSLLEVLIAVDGGSIGARVLESWRSGVGVSGASAGAMVMCARTATPDRANGIADGLDLVAGLAVPHWSPGSERRWRLPDGLVWGLPECGGVLIAGTDMTAVGRGNPSVRIDGSWHRIARDGSEPVPT